MCFAVALLARDEGMRDVQGYADSGITGAREGDPPWT